MNKIKPILIAIFKKSPLRKSDRNLFNKNRKVFNTIQIKSKIKNVRNSLMKKKEGDIKFIRNELRNIKKNNTDFTINTNIFDINSK